jgi:hypothetical protein
MYIAITVAVLIVAGLGFYAGSLLSKVKAQKDARNKKTQDRVDTITLSIQTIAKAVSQQQCNLSEASIRLYHLLEAIPVNNKPDYSHAYPSIYALYEQVKDLPTHQARKEQSKLETRKQDMKREEIEAQLESKILLEMQSLSTFSV